MISVPKAAWVIASIAVTATVAVALVVSASNSGTAPRDAYTSHANRLCRIASREVAAARERYGDASPGSPLASLAESLARIIGDVRARLGTLSAPPDRIAAIVSMEAAMFEAEEQLIQVAQRRSRAVDTRRADAASARVKAAASSAGLAQ